MSREATSFSDGRVNYGVQPLFHSGSNEATPFEARSPRLSERATRHPELSFNSAVSRPWSVAHASYGAGGATGFSEMLLSSPKVTENFTFAS